ncbi:putative Amino acid permease 6 [Cocos nucifera]|uniref:Putative Amino acid permease 6 n=1 Tax=Cocos nucifera TaxID=13894 RepID=A0A8K0IEK9_COCNU|nr:putative Amino acid permease 6 [Cocos nucifera]
MEAGLGFEVAKGNEAMVDFDDDGRVKRTEGVAARTTLTGVTVGVDVSAGEKVWRTFQALGNMAFAFTYSNVLIEIEDTLESNPPENQVMKKASNIGVSITTVFYMLCGVLGYAAFGNDAPGNFLTGFGFYEPFWLVDVGNICVAIHLIGAYQVFTQPVFQVVENWWHGRWSRRHLLTMEHVVSIPLLGDHPFSFFRLVWRALYVILTTVIAMIFPFFNDFVGLIGAISYWPLTVYFPIEMFVARAKIRRFSAGWTWLKVLSFGCLVVALLGTCGSLQGLIHSVKGYKPFKSA